MVRTADSMVIAFEISEGVIPKPVNRMDRRMTFLDVMTLDWLPNIPKMKACKIIVERIKAGRRRERCRTIEKGRQSEKGRDRERKRERKEEGGGTRKRERKRER